MSGTAARTDRNDPMRLSQYERDGFYDEMFDETGMVRPEAKLLLETLESLEEGQLQRCQMAAERLLIQLGITFNVYGDSAGTERAFPVDLIPRILRADTAALASLAIWQSVRGDR